MSTWEQLINEMALRTPKGKQREMAIRRLRHMKKLGVLNKNAMKEAIEA